jgi:hypothetical protein
MVGICQISSELSYHAFIDEGQNGPYYLGDGNVRLDA